MKTVTVIRSFSEIITMASWLSVPLSISKSLPRFCHFRLHSLRCLSLCDSSAPSRVSTNALSSNYREAFSRRMAMAGIEPHHRIAVGVSGGPDSMALCALSAQWKIDGLKVARDCEGFIDGIIAVVVDHGLRSESRDEADMVSRWVSKMGVRCEISQCEWLNGRPKQGHLQEEARDMRYQHFQKVCIQNQISVLLIAQHADDQAELFILRLSRNSGVLGLAGMPFVSQIFSSYAYSCDLKNYGILLVRPLLDFSKEDMYKICQEAGQNWVEDPTNQSVLYARNRIRISLRDYSSCRFNSELQAVISACQRTRSYVDYTCFNLMNKVVTTMDLGYAVVDLEILNQLKSEDIVMSRFVTLILQFISQRNRPVRGSTLKLVLDYIRNFPCKTSLTAAGCYLCPAPSSRGTKVLICYSVNHLVPRTMGSLSAESFVEQQHQASSEIEQIVARSKSGMNSSVLDAEKVLFLDTKSDMILSEAKRLDMLSDSTCGKILELQNEEVKLFRSSTEVTVTPELASKDKVKSISMYEVPLCSGEKCYFMNRFLVTWKLNIELPMRTLCTETGHDHDSGRKKCCRSCLVSDNSMVLNIRHMAESDWMYLANLLKTPISKPFQETEDIDLCTDRARLSAQKALRILKSIPVAVRRGLPVLVDTQGILLSIPSIGFKHCPRLETSAIFRPRVPLGGGYSLFI